MLFLFMKKKIFETFCRQLKLISLKSLQQKYIKNIIYNNSNNKSSLEFLLIP